MAPPPMWLVATAPNLDRRDKQTSDPVALCAALREVMPANTVYAEEVTSHRAAVSRHVTWERPHQYYHPSGGLGQGLGLALEKMSHERFRV